jgi:hypothetical protein
MKVPGPLVAALMCLPLMNGCASRIDLRAGAAGPAIPPASGLALIGITPQDSPLAVSAREAVVKALARRGHVLAAEGPARIEIGLTDRLASTGVGVIGGAPLSPAKSRKFLQSCKDHTYRLTLTYYSAAPDVAVTRAWAEEQHCKGTIAESIAGLADKAVAALARGSSSETSKRRGLE